MADQITSREITMAEINSPETVLPGSESPASAVTVAATPAGEELALPWKLMLFVTLQVLLVAGGGAWAGYRLHQHRQERELPVFQNQPLRVLPTYDRPEVISDAELSSVLTQLAPRFREQKVGVNAIDHALRFWGAEARFPDPACYAGAEMRDMLLDQRQFSTVWGDKTPEFLVRTRGGVRARVAEGEATASHVDHTLATMAEIGTPLDYPIVTRRGDAKLRELLAQALRDFSLNQIEYEWSTLVFALYQPTPKTWFTSEGQRISFDTLAERIMRQELPQGVCYGNHRLYTLAALLRLDDQQDLISDATHQAIVDFLKDVTARLVKNQKAEGFWDGGWSGLKGAGDVVGPGQTILGNRILATGHALEWWAIAPAEVHPPKEVIEKGARWLIKTIQPMTPREITVNYTFLSHAGRALALWRGKLPYQVPLLPPKPEQASQDKEKGDAVDAKAETSAETVTPEPSTPETTPAATGEAAP